MILLLFLGCGEPAGAPPAAPPASPQADPLALEPAGPVGTERLLSLARDIQPIFDEHCVDGCHVDGVSTMPMEPENTYASMVDVASVGMPLMDRVEPGDPDLSYLMHKLWGTYQEVGGMGAAMPIGEDPLPDEQVALIELWIRQGARP